MPITRLLPHWGRHIRPHCVLKKILLGAVLRKKPADALPYAQGSLIGFKEIRESEYPDAMFASYEYDARHRTGA